MKAKSILVASFLSFGFLSYAQNVGINVDTPRATLDIHGNLKVDSLPLSTSTQVFVVVTDSLGFFSRQSIVPVWTGVAGVIRKTETLVYTTDGF